MGARLDSAKLQEWRRRLTRFGSSGLTVAAYCRREGIAPTRFYYWQRRVQQADDSVKVSSRSHALSDPSSGCIEVFIGDQIRLRIPSADPDALISVLRGLHGLSPQQRGFQHVVLNDALAARL